MRQQCYLGVHGSRGGADPGAAMVSNWRQWRQLASRAAAAFCPARALCAAAGAGVVGSGGGAVPAAPAVSNWRQWRQLGIRAAAFCPAQALCAAAGAGVAGSGGGAVPAAPAVSNWRQWRQFAVYIAPRRSAPGRPVAWRAERPQRHRRSAIGASGASWLSTSLPPARLIRVIIMFNSSSNN